MLRHAIEVELPAPLAGRGRFTWLARYFGCIAFLAAAGSAAAPPQLYHQSAYQSPVEGGPDDLILLAGYALSADDTVVYQALRDTTAAPTPPPNVPQKSTANIGTAPMVSTADVPYSLTVRLPPEVLADQSYALWIRTSRGEWSQPVKINDARPLWLTPSFAYATAPVASLPRELKIVGRNLQPARGRTTLVRLLGPTPAVLPTIPDEVLSATMAQHVARIRLPRYLAPGHYQIEVSRDGLSWVAPPDSLLEVRPDPHEAPEFSVDAARFGGCRPDDGRDDTACILQAVAAAKRAGGGSVYFGPGAWELSDGEQPGLAGDEGLLVPEGVNLRGAGKTVTQLRRHAEWTQRRPAGAAFTLTGNTTVTGITFRDLQVYEARDHAGPFIQLGESYDRAAAASPTSAGAPSAAMVDEIFITDNVFDKTMVAIGNAGLPIDHLFVTFNDFGAFNSSIELAGNGYNMINKYRIDNSVVAHNRFFPGSKLDMIGKSGTLATELGAGYRVDFSDNTADGTATDYLYTKDDAKGWRAGFFWNMNGNVEEMLVSKNSATCTGDKIGDGEAIAFDNNANTFALPEVSDLVGATAAGITVAVPLVPRQNRRDVPISRYYVGHWVQVVDGPGLGQARKITAYSTDAALHRTTFQVAPAWDVVPVPGTTRIAIGREMWQVYTLDNRVDNRRPLCQKSNRTRHNAGVITMWAQSADSVIAGNHQYDSDGIFVHQIYVLPDHPCTDCNMESLFQFFLDIRDNTVDGEYDWSTDCSTSGIAVGAAASATDDPKPPTVGFGVSISHNAIRHADAQYGGAIAQLSTWYAGPPPHRWPLSDNLLIHHNTLADIDGADAFPLCGKGRPRVGIAFPDPAIAWHTTLYANTCRNVPTPIGPGGVRVTSLCDGRVSESCECRASPR